jgi:hypothetical protein
MSQIETGPTAVHIDEARMHRERPARARAALRRHGLAAALLFDPISVCYLAVPGAFAVFNLHVTFRWTLVPYRAGRGGRGGSRGEDRGRARRAARERPRVRRSGHAAARRLAPRRHGERAVGTFTGAAHKSGAEWCETRLLSSGPRTIPEFRPGASFEELGRKLGPRLPAEFHALRYPFIAHGTGMVDEYPCVKLDDHHEGELEVGMVMSVEAYVGAVGGSQGVKLEEQIVIGDDGPEIISESPYDERLLA